MSIPETNNLSFNIQVKLASKLYWQTLIKTFNLALRNMPALLLIGLYVLDFYIGFYFFLSKKYIVSILAFALFTFFISSIFYIIGQIVKNGKFHLKDLLKSYKVLYLRSNLMIILWYFAFFLINYAVITPISVMLKGKLLLYGVTVPMILLIFFMFNSLPEAVYASERNFESLLMDCINFIERYWFVWLVPMILTMLLLNLSDHRLSIMPTLGHLDPKGIYAKIQDIAFYIRSMIFTLALIFRGLLYTELNKSDN